MKKKVKTVDVIKKYGIILFCSVTVTMNVVNYVRNDASRELGRLYEWSSEAENATVDEEKAINGKDIDNAGEDAEKGDFPPVNLNEATSEELQTISGIGPTKAGAIIEYRKKYGGFVAIEEIMQVKGIGEGTFSKIKDFICVD